MNSAKEKKEKNAHLWVRHPDDWYVEERFAVAELFKMEAFEGVIWDPCCGRGHILAEARAAGYEAWGSDLKQRTFIQDAYGAFAGPLDFLKYCPFALGEAVVMNPPYLHGEGIEAFIRQAMSYPTVKKIAAFVPAKFLWGAERARGLHRTLPPARVYMITPRPSCPPGPVLEAGEEAGGGFEDFAWVIYARDHLSPAPDWYPAYPTELRWIIGPDKRKRKAKAA